MHKNIEFKVGLFLIAVFITIVLSAGFIAYKKGMFEEYFYVNLSSKSGDGISRGMPVNFWGFEIGKVSKIRLNQNAEIMLQVEIPTKYSKWVNSSSDFTLEKPLIGSSKIVIRTQNLQARNLADDEIIKLKIVDGIDEIIAKVTPVVEQAEIITQNIEKITSDLASKESLIAMITGDKRSEKDLINIIKNLEYTTSSLNKMLTNIDGSIYGENGVIADIKEVFLKLDEILINIEKITADTADTTDSLPQTKKEIDMAIKNANDLMIEIESKIPFKDKKEVKLP